MLSVLKGPISIRGALPIKRKELIILKNVIGTRLYKPLLDNKLEQKNTETAIVYISHSKEKILRTNTNKKEKSLEMIRHMSQKDQSW